MKRIDFEKIYYHPDFLHRYLKEDKIIPYHMSVGLISRCNHNCRWCYIDFAKNNLAIDPDVLLGSLREAVLEWGLKAVTIVGMGEPTLHPDFSYIIREMAGMKLDIGIFTNGSKLQGEVAKSLLRATFVRVSLDAATSETHMACHGTSDFNKIIRKINDFVALKKSQKTVLPTIGIQFATSDINAHEIIAVSHLASDLGVDYLSYKPVYKNKNNPHHPENNLSIQEARRLITEAKKNENETFQIYCKLRQFEDVLGEEKRPYAKCLVHSVSPYIEEDGAVACCGNLYPKSVIGNIYESKLTEIWYGGQHKKFIESLDLSQCVKGCKYHRLNILLYDLLNPNPELHVNFI